MWLNVVSLVLSVVCAFLVQIKKSVSIQNYKIVCYTLP